MSCPPSTLGPLAYLDHFRGQPPHTLLPIIITPVPAKKPRMLAFTPWPYSFRDNP
jgi:hypothetical protein